MNLTKYKVFNRNGVNRNLNKNIWSHIVKTRKAYEVYSLQEEKSAWRQISFSIVFILFSLCFILIAVLVGFNLARRLSKPIGLVSSFKSELRRGCNSVTQPSGLFSGG